MLVDNINYKTIWSTLEKKINIIDQTYLPFTFKEIEINSLEDAIEAISSMRVRGAPLIGVTAAYGIYLSTKNSCTNEDLINVGKKLILTRPTAINLKWAVEKIISNLLLFPENQRQELAYGLAEKLAVNDENINQKIGIYGSEIIEKIFKKTNKPVNILTHCNAGWLATVDWGTATAPIYKARDKNIPVHVWVDETRPRNQGSFLTSWELKNENIEHTIIADNAGGHLMQNGLVDIVITGSDRTTYTGDVCNKIGTYLKALAAYENNIPFYVALPSSTIDWEIEDGKDINIEERNQDEVHFIRGLNKNGKIENFRVTPLDTNASNYSFDVTPRKFISGLITEFGVYKAAKTDIIKIKEKLQ
tara:strand:+ start:2716 stop:3798 length:1083 start_codon:yes stop_codon:yes gene_type:complete